MSKYLCIIVLFAALSPWHARADNEFCPCPGFHGHVCGTDNITYKNLCLLKCAQKRFSGLRVAFRGRCDDNPKVFNVIAVPPPFCALTYEPICGTNNITYLNMCSLSFAAIRSEGVEVIQSGPCSHA